jgi:hypothetical protein
MHSIFHLSKVFTSGICRSIIFGNFPHIVTCHREKITGKLGESAYLRVERHSSPGRIGSAGGELFYFYPIFEGETHD